MLGFVQKAFTTAYGVAANIINLPAAPDKRVVNITPSDELTQPAVIILKEETPPQGIMKSIATQLYSLTGQIYCATGQLYDWGVAPLRRYTDKKVDEFFDAVTEAEEAEDEEDENDHKSVNIKEAKTEKEKTKEADAEKEKSNKEPKITKFQKLENDSIKARVYVSELLEKNIGNSVIGRCVINYIDGLVGVQFSWPRLYNALSTSPKARALFVQSIVDNFCNYMFFVAALQWWSEDEEDEQRYFSPAALIASVMSLRLLLRYLILNMTLNSAVAETFKENQYVCATDEHCNHKAGYSLTAFTRSPAHYITNMVALMLVTASDSTKAFAVYAAIAPIFWGRAVGGARRNQCLECDEKFWAIHNVYAHGLGTAMLLTTKLVNDVVSAALGMHNSFVTDAVFSVVYQWYIMLVILDPNVTRPDPMELNMSHYVNMLADLILNDIVPKIENAVKHPKKRGLVMRSLVFAGTSPSRELIFGHDFSTADTAIRNKSIRAMLQAHESLIHNILDGLFNATDSWDFYAGKKADKVLTYLNLPKPSALNVVPIVNRLRKDTGLLSNATLIAGMSLLRRAQEPLDGEQQFKGAKIKVNLLNARKNVENYKGDKREEPPEVPVATSLTGDNSLPAVQIIDLDKAKQGSNELSEEEIRKKKKEYKKSLQQSVIGVIDDYDDNLQQKSPLVTGSGSNNKVKKK